MNRIKKQCTKLLSILVCCTCMITIFILPAQAADLDTYYKSEFKSLLSACIGKIPVAGAVSSETVSTLIMDLLGLDDPAATEKQLTEINNKLDALSKNVKSILDQMETDKNIRGFNDKATAMKNLCDDFIHDLTYISQIETQLDSLSGSEKTTKQQELDSFKNEQFNKNPIMDKYCNGNLFYIEVQNMGDYLLGEGGGQTKDAMNAYYDFCKNNVQFAQQAFSQSEKYEAYAMNTYTKAVFVTSVGFIEKVKYCNETERASILEKLNTLSNQYQKVCAVYDTLQKQKEKDKLLFVPDKVNVRSDTASVTLQNGTQEKALDESLNYSTVQKIIQSCPGNKTLRSYFNELGIKVDGASKYIAVDKVKKQVDSFGYYGTCVIDTYYKANVVSLDSLNKKTETITYYHLHETPTIFATKRSETVNPISVIMLKPE